jgi:hypothetical protein
MTEEMKQYLIFAAIAFAGYLLRYFGVNLPGLPAPPATKPATPAPSPVLEQVVGELKQHIADVENAQMKTKLIQTLVDKPAK